MMTEPNHVHAEYTLTAQEWREARLTASRTGKPLHPIRGLLGWLVFVALAVLLVTWVQKSKAPPVARGTATPPAAAPTDSLFSTLLPLIPSVFVFGFIGFFIARQFGFMGGGKRNPSLQTIHTLDVDDEGVQVATNVETVHWRWDAFVGWSEGRHLLLLRLERRAVVPIPKRALDAAQLEQLRRLATERAVPRSGGFPVQPADPAGATGPMGPTGQDS